MVIRSDEATANNVYDQLAGSYGQDLAANTTNRLKFELILKYIRKTDDVIDVGCANGIHLQPIAACCSSLTGIDINQRMLEAAASLCASHGLDNVALRQCSASALDFPDGSFDMSYSYSTLLLVPDIGGAIAEIFRVTKPGGVAILDIAGRYNLSQWHWSRYYRRQGHFGINSFGRSEIRRYLRHVGWQVIEEHALGFTDQWKYLPFFGRRLKLLDKLFHSGRPRDPDYRISNLAIFSRLANRWFIVCRKADRPAS